MKRNLNFWFCYRNLIKTKIAGITLYAEPRSGMVAPSAANVTGAAASGLPALAPNGRRTEMSSELSSVLKSKDLTMLQGVLDAAGYCSASSVAHPERYNVAAKLLIERFRHGMTSADDLSRELERHFGTVISAVSPPSFERTRAAIQGRPLQ
ncbi:hypothetical protein J2W42_006482 [Rhizobium tibeticum]|nr:hypothetical protein [Rhizobium tibeticum]MDP9813608.1 hypothetical protein [Rhizobium tibeticum]